MPETPYGIEASFGGSLESTLSAVGRAKRYHRWLAETLADHVVGRAVEIGAGYGTLSEALVPFLGSVMVTEPHPMLEASLRQAASGMDGLVPAPPIALPLTAEPSWPEHPHTAIMSNVLEHIEDDIAALASIRRYVQSVHRLILVVPAHMWAYSKVDEALGHHRRYTTQSLRQVLRESGWQPTLVRYFNPVGAIAWASGRWLGRREISARQTRMVEAVVPLLKSTDKLACGRGLGQSVIAVADAGKIHS